MSRTLTVHLERPIASARILDGYNINPESSVTDSIDQTANTDQVKLAENLKTQGHMYEELCRTLQGLVAKLNQFYDQIFVEQKEEIAKLSVEIARKVLMRKIQDGDYEIESIVKETLKNAPTHEDLIVHLNTEDLAVLQKAQADKDNGNLAGIKFVPDPNIGRAECVLESSKGIIKSLIEEHLEQIGKALEKAE